MGESKIHEEKTEANKTQKKEENETSLNCIEVGLDVPQLDCDAHVRLYGKGRVSSSRQVSSRNL